MIAVLALVIYLLIRLVEKRRGVRQPRPQQPPRRPVVAPDDDVDFLRELERRRRRQQRDGQPEQPDN
ncbi:hypothetical protein [Nocardioides mesophilus]|uniref:hypothetical protein n=1 Tax=Nocardioides mesophilus TaxID=433659 RepID=UPI001CB6CFFC|nr:hypothetical protein [Nocardioides mesophilus]